MRAILMVSSLTFAVLVACSPLPPSGGATTSSSSGGGMGGAGGACPMGPQATFDLTITASGGVVPRDTTINVAWSAGAEPMFSLDQPSTWKTIEHANIVCEVDATKPPPEALPALVCQLWTTGPTNVVVKAQGYLPFEKTYTATYSDRCHAPVPTAINVALEPTLTGDSGP